MKDFRKIYDFKLLTLSKKQKLQIIWKHDILNYEFSFVIYKESLLFGKTIDDLHLDTIVKNGGLPIIRDLDFKSDDVKIADNIEVDILQVPPTLENKALEIIMDDDAIIIDVRTEEELEENPPISDDVYNIPFNNKFIEIIEEEELDKDTKILIYCSHGVRSIKAALLMREKGFTNVFSLEGGLEAILSGDGC